MNAIDSVFIKFIFLVISISLVFMFYTGGRLINNKKNKARVVIICILSYALILGVRFLRGNDYLHYIDVYNYDLEYSEVIFTSFNHLLKFFCVGEHWIFFYYSLVFIIGAFFLLREYKEYGKWIFPSFVIANVYLSEYYIRQAVGFSFVYVYVALLLNRHITLKKIFGLVILSILAYTFHSSCGLAICLITLIYFLRKPIPMQYGIILFLFSSFLFSSIFDLSILNELIQALAGVNNKFYQYAQDSDRWFSQDAVVADAARKSLIKVFQTFGELSLISLGYIIVKKLNSFRFTFVYNIYVVGLILDQAFFQMEIMRRLFDPLYWFWFAPVSFVLYYKNYIIRCNKRYRFLYWGLFWFLYEYLKYLFMTPARLNLFLWNIN